MSEGNDDKKVDEQSVSRPPRFPAKAKMKVEVEFELDDERIFNLQDGGLTTTLVTSN
ncbi:MAG: hypothetical protein HWD84_11160 [Flavobacteriaceae bacterium]|nr:hypothetical protein [Flavobacteriaceae bacterium]